MSRWPLLAAFSLAPLLLGCGSSVRPGLSNAPRLGGTALADEQIHDVVSNGDDGCGLHPEHGGVLRGRIPPCPGAAHPLARTSWLPTSAPSPADEGLVVPWLQHFYVGWPCANNAPRKPAARKGTRTFAWDVSIAPESVCRAGDRF